MGSQRYRCCPPQTLSIDATCATDHCKNKHHHREKKELKYLPLFISPKLRSSSDFAYASSILIPLGWAVRYKELPLALKMPFFHLSFNRRVKTEKYFFWAWWEVLSRQPGWLLSVLQATAAQVSTTSLLTSPWNSTVLRGPALEARGWCIPCSHMHVPKRAILAPLRLPETVESDEAEG